MALEKLYSVKEIAAYFGVTESTVLRWIAEWQKSKTTDNPKGLRAEKLNGSYRAKESWVRAYARVLYPEAG